MTVVIFIKQPQNNTNMNTLEFKKYFESYLYTREHYRDVERAVGGGLRKYDIYRNNANELYVIIACEDGDAILDNKYKAIILKYFYNLPQYHGVSDAIADGLGVGDYYLQAPELIPSNCSVIVKQILQLT